LSHINCTPTPGPLVSIAPHTTSPLVFHCASHTGPLISIAPLSLAHSSSIVLHIPAHSSPLHPYPWPTCLPLCFIYWPTCLPLCFTYQPTHLHCTPTPGSLIFHCALYTGPLVSIVPTCLHCTPTYEAQWKTSGPGKTSGPVVQDAMEMSGMSGPRVGV
jgi:hypothetical protein